MPRKKHHLPLPFPTRGLFADRPGMAARRTPSTHSGGGGGGGTRPRGRHREAERELPYVCTCGKIDESIDRPNKPHRKSWALTRSRRASAATARSASRPFTPADTAEMSLASVVAPGIAIAGEPPLLPPPKLLVLQGDLSPSAGAASVLPS